MEIRTLRRDERAACLELLDGWSLPDGWRGREFFARFIDHDPSYRDEDIWVAAEGGELLACVQIFAREIGIRGIPVPLGGIGSVFTRESARGQGLASRLLRRSVDAMRERGIEVSLLFAARFAFYTALGWSCWGVRGSLVERGEPSRGAAEGSVLADFDPERDLPAVRALHQQYSGRRDGNVVRDAGLWAASLRLGGNPLESFRLARRDGRVVAYLRATRLSGILVLTELGREDGAAADLAELVVDVQRPREADPFASLERPSAEFRRVAFTPGLGHDPELAAALAGRGVGVRPYEDRSAMLRCLDAPALARRLGVPCEPGETPEAFLRRVLPPERLVFWPADRF